MAIDHHELVSRLALEIWTATERLNAGECLEEDLPSSADLARKLGYRLENVKKKLRVLKESSLIQPISVTPKRYRFNEWTLRNMDESHPFYEMFYESGSPHYLALGEQAERSTAW